MSAEVIGPKIRLSLDLQLATIFIPYDYNFNTPTIKL